MCLLGAFLSPNCAFLSVTLSEFLLIPIGRFYISTYPTLFIYCMKYKQKQNVHIHKCHFTQLRYHSLLQMNIGVVFTLISHFVYCAVRNRLSKEKNGKINVHKRRQA